MTGEEEGWGARRSRARPIFYPFTENPVPEHLRFGVDVLLGHRERWRRWTRVALVTNDAARLAAAPAARSREALAAAGLPLVRLFGPEHGLGAAAADGAAVADAVDPCTGLPVVSLYGSRMRPTPAQLADLDAVLFDIPDVGARFYTYAWTLWHVLHACADAAVPLVVLDRPNPLGGDLSSAEGPLLDAACRSFIGEDDIPVRHSLTIGELGRLWQREHCPHAVLDVIPCDGWDPTRAWPATGLPWIPTSPAMPSFESVMWYPGTCLFEATNVSVGRGTDVPFVTIGAPWLQARAVADALRAPGVRATPHTLVPGSGPHAGERCAGIRLTIDPATSPADFVARALRPVAVGLQLLAAVMALHPRDFAWMPYPTAANPSGENHLARLIGRVDCADQLAALSPARRAPTLAAWTGVPGWSERVGPVLVYERA
jgi:uncharacterized protein YbbC (DUF1343 family)